MSEQVTREMDVAEESEVTGGGSLKARMGRRGRELESQRSEVFEVPGYDEIIAVELRMLGYEESRKIGQRVARHTREVAMQELYAFCDQILAATEGFFEVDGDRRVPIDATWTSLARDASPVKLPEELTPRQALISLVGDRRVAYLFTAWEEWMRGERSDVDEEVVRDFGTTG